ncbi:MAG: CDP-glycerol glycerophosphotransferase family protein [Rahnella inusitata]|uniref:CDP-glycerol:glycerophosphate glycerophosphotransferase n=1 Tax=Rahnella inusitata TaxID=58169 RepID=UPI002F3A91C3
MIHRKLRKLRKNPRLFFKDMVNNRITYNKSLLKKNNNPNGHFTYTVISAVYGVEKYLDSFFASLTKQSLDFKSNIKIIMVDDGSLDGSKQKILNWCLKYPNNIKYIYKENGGQASARNLGMNFADTDWITFIDPDDTVDVNYFSNVDNFIHNETDDKLAIVCCNLIYNIENKGTSNRHPLKNRFENGDRTLKICDLKNEFQLSASASFFNNHIIKNTNIKFPDNVKPNFEDGHFVASYMLDNQKMSIGFCKSAIYLYLKREDNSSTIDNSLIDSRRYSQVIENGYLDILKKSLTYNKKVPLWLQTEILYELFWLIKYLVNNESRSDFLTPQEKITFKKLLVSCFEYIDDKTIIDYSLAGCWFYHKKGILNTFKNRTTKFEIVYLEKNNKNNKTAKFSYFSNDKDSIESLESAGVKYFPIARKTINHTFLSDIFIYEHFVTFDLSVIDNAINIFVNGIKARISINSYQHNNAVSLDKLDRKTNGMTKISKIARFLRSHSINTKPAIYKNSWLFMDRDIQADDNAEHLYRHISKEHPEVNAFFVLRKSSHDWQRLKKENFNLIPFGSKEHKIALAWAEHVISSHADQYIVAQLNPPFRFIDNDIRYTFLQHGVTKDDISDWLNKKPIDLFITTTTDEHNSIIKDGSSYKFSENEVVLTGMPRYDKLYKMSKKTIKKNILIMPTWRNGIVGKATGQGNDRDLNKNFHENEYAIQWKKFLHSPTLKKLASDENNNIIFFPHVNIKPYIDGFDIPSYVNTMIHSPDVSIQKVFSEAIILITDYSSVAFDVAYINTPVIYFQFDREKVFSSGLHIYKNGYFNYFKDGFGPVCLDIKELEIALNLYHKRKYKLESKFKKIINKTFTQRNGGCCERIYEKIIALNKNDTKIDQYSIAREEAVRAEKAGYYDLAQTRYLSITSNPKANMYDHAMHGAIRCATKAGNISYLIEAKKTFNIQLKDFFAANIHLMAFYEDWHKLGSIKVENIPQILAPEEYAILLRSSLENGSDSYPLFEYTAKKLKIDIKVWEFYHSGDHISLLDNLSELSDFYYAIEQLKIKTLCNLQKYDSAELLIDNLKNKLQKWQYYRSYGRLRAEQDKNIRAKWHYDRCLINGKYELPYKDLRWLECFREENHIPPESGYSNSYEIIANNNFNKNGNESIYSLLPTY